MPTVAVTGANGYVGGVIAAALQSAGWNLIELSRKPSTRGSAEAGTFRKFSLNEKIEPKALEGIDALVHCAYDFASIDAEGIQKSNVAATLQLFNAARSAGVTRIVFISSMSAFEGCKSLYGQAKLAVEREADKLGFNVVRPGLVYGPAAQGMVGSLKKLARLPLIMPMVGLGKMCLYLAHQDDLAALVIRLLDSSVSVPSGPIIAANDQPRTLRQIVELLSAAEGKGRKLMLPIPGIALWAGLGTVEMLGGRIRLRSDSLTSLLNQDTHPDFSATRQTGVPFRPFTAASMPSAARASPR